MKKKVVLDLTRLSNRKSHATPTGIDRVEFAYLKHFLECDLVDLTFVVARGASIRFYSRKFGEKIADFITDAWSSEEKKDERVSEAFQKVVGFLEGEPVTALGAHGKSFLERSSWLNEIRNEFCLLLSDRIGPVNDGVYINVGHTNLHSNALTEWLKQAGIVSCMMVYDLIPIDFPEYNMPGQDLIHEKRMRCVSEYATHVIAISCYTQECIESFFRKNGLRVPETSVIWIGLEEAISLATTDDKYSYLDSSSSYFVILGTLEPRKNHLLILNLWRSLCEEFGTAAPKLVVVGRRGWENGSIIAMLDRCRQIEDVVIEAPGLSDQEVSGLLKHCCGVLVPSFVEGFSYPVVEAIAKGVPVLASDIAVHKEVSAGRATLLDPLDGRAWKMEVLALWKNKEENRIAASVVTPHPFLDERMKWFRHFEEVQRILEL
ncbi:glycosyltransferase family 4 protein [Desulfosediminicola sp.]|uniref:glycosyltransferase family 4 protein n=1 Tax=Desulfosediminicola sp. TaxID=2886825 RepID=UPI003AF20FEE